MATPWHRIFGMALTQYLAGTGWQVDVEVDLSLQQQRLDVVVLRRAGGGPEPLWPDGFGTPTAYNLITFKALPETLDDWTIKELAGHGVTYRKYVSPDVNHLLPESDFRLLAASMRFPRTLSDRVPLLPRGEGTYDVVWGTDVIRILVLREMPEAEQNLVWNLFSGDPQRIAGAFQQIQPQNASWSSIINLMLERYGLEGMKMPYTMEDFEREAAESLLRRLSPEQRLKGLSPEERLKGLSPEKRLEGLSPEKRLEGLSPEKRLEGLSLEKRLEGLSPEEIERYLKQLKAGQVSKSDG